MLKVQIQIVTWNSAAFLAQLFTGIRRQTGVDYSVLVIDNNSQDETRQWLKNNASGARLIGNNENVGFAKAHNQGFALAQTQFVLTLNPDSELQADYLKTLLPLFTDELVASAGGKLYRQLPEAGKYGIIDSRGLETDIFGRVSEIEAGLSDKGRLEQVSEVFGISAAAALYRLSALRLARDKWGIFDERFGSYKEDADLAWRLKKKGFKALICPAATALHPRAARKGNRAQRPDEVKKMSIRNHLLMLKKNLSAADWWRLPFIVSYEAAKFAYIVLFEKNNLSAYREFLSFRS